MFFKPNVHVNMITESQYIRNEFPIPGQQNMEKMAASTNVT